MQRLVIRLMCVKQSIAVISGLIMGLLMTSHVIAIEHQGDHVGLKDTENPQSFSFVGRAYEPESGALLYTERHDILLNNQGRYQRAHVTYRDEQGNVFAEKTLEYGEAATLPKTHFFELDSPFFFKVKLNDDTVALEYQDEEEQFKDKVKVEADHFAVVDAGFDRLVNKHWQTLSNGQALQFSFLAVTRSAFYEFRLVPVAADDTDTLKLRLEPDNAVLRWLLDPAYLTYDSRSQKLLRFEGLTNIRKRVDGKALDENYIAVIEYDYL